MRRLYIHCGLAKTGTTSLQDYLAQRRPELRALGFDYPEIGINKRGIAQQNLALGILKGDTADTGGDAIADLLNILRDKNRAPTVVISSETFSGCIAHKSAQERFFEFIRAVQETNDEVYAVLTFRKFWTHMESSYLERLKNGKPRKIIPDQIDGYSQWLESLLTGLGKLGELMGEDRVLALDVQSKFSGSIDAMLSTLGIREDQLPARADALNVRLSMKKSAYLYQFQYDPCGTHNKRPKSEIVSIASMLKRIRNFEADKTSYHILSMEEANQIQAWARDKMPPYLAGALEKLTEPETVPYEATDLGDIRFTEKDRKMLRKVRARFGR